jgi:MOSC domain-containing protein YiiM
LTGRVVSVASALHHQFSKLPTNEIRIIEGLGVEGDAHSGVTVKHRSRVAIDPAQPNLRQLHLIHAELLDDLAVHGFSVRPGDLGENITTRGIDLLSLPRGTRLNIGDSVVLEVTGLRNPCVQIERFQPGLLAAVIERADDGAIIRKAGVMAIALRGGSARVNDRIEVLLPATLHRPLEPV